MKKVLIVLNPCAGNATEIVVSGQCAVLRGRKFAKFYLRSFDGIIFHVKCYLRSPDGQILRVKCYLRNPDGQILHQNNAPNFQTDKF